MRRFLAVINVPIVVGMSIGGFGQIVMLIGAKKMLTDESFLAVITWNSLAGLAALLLASPLVGIVVISRNRNQEYISTAFKGSLTVAPWVSTLLVITWILGLKTRIGVFEVFESGMLVISVYIQILSGFQRGELSALGKWRLVAAQFSIDGIVRAAGSVGYVFFGGGSSTAFVFISFLSPLISVYVVQQIYRIEFPESDNPEGGFATMKVLFPLWVASLGMHLMLTVSPSLVSIAGGSAMIVANIGLLLYIIRIPITLSGSFLGPFLNQMVGLIDSDQKIEAKKLLGKYLINTTLISSAGFPAVYLLDPIFQNYMEIKNIYLENWIGVAFYAASIMCLIACELQFFQMASGNLRIIGVGWFVVTGLFLSMIFAIQITEAKFIAVFTVSIFLLSGIFAFNSQKVK